MKMNSHSPKPMGHSEDSPEREVHSDIDLHKKDRNFSNKQPNPTSTRTGGTTINKSQKEWNNQDQSRIKKHRD